MGENVDEGEVRQLIVEGGWWKASELLEEDLDGDDQERIGCLISEVVVRESLFRLIANERRAKENLPWYSRVRLARSRLLGQEWID